MLSEKGHFLKVFAPRIMAQFGDLPNTDTEDHSCHSFEEVKRHRVPEGSGGPTVKTEIDKIVFSLQATSLTNSGF